MPTERSIAWLSSERAYQQLTETNKDIYLIPNHCSEVREPYSWIRRRIEAAEGEGDPIWRPHKSTNLDPWGIPETELPIRQHTGAGGRPWHIQRRGLPVLATVGGDVPNFGEIWNLGEVDAWLRGAPSWRQVGGGMEWGKVKGAWEGEHSFLIDFFKFAFQMLYHFLLSPPKTP